MTGIWILVVSVNILNTSVLMLDRPEIPNGPPLITYASKETCEETVKQNKRFFPNINYKCLEATTMYGQADVDKAYREWKSKQ